MGIRRAVVVPAVLLAFVVGQVACSAARSDLPDGVAAVTGRAPALPTATLDGGRVPDLSTKVLVVNFWNPYCPPCRVEAPALEAAARRFGALGVEVVGVHYTGRQWPKSVADALSFVRAAHVTYPIVGDSGSALAKGYGIAGIPTTVVVDASGQMRFRVSGPVKAGVLADLLARVLQHGAGRS